MLRSLIEKWWFWPALVLILAGTLLRVLPSAFGVRSVFLWTDILLFILVALLIVLVAYIRSQPHLRLPWRQVLRRPLAVASLIVLCVYAGIGLLDSVHFRLPLPPAQMPATGVVADSKPANAEVHKRFATHYSVEVLSLLDVLAQPLREHVEQTYSAPFATRLFSRETVRRADGTQVREYARLRYGGAQLKDPAQADADIARRLGQAARLAFSAWLVLVVAIGVLRARHRGVGFKPAITAMWHGRDVWPWRSVFITVFGVFFVFAAVVLLAPYYHIFGTDKVGQDVFYQSLKSIRTGLAIGTLTTLVMLPFAILLGIMAGYFRGWIDDLIQYLYTTLNSIPGVLLIAAAILSIQVYIANHPDLFETATDRSDLRLLALCVVLGITSWTSLCRLLRGEALKLREVDFIEAATAFGVRHFTIIGRHILPNVMHIVLIIVVLDFSGLVLAEAVLSYVGVGVDPSTQSWGNMINGARLELAREPVVWWSLAAAFVMMFAMVLAANLFADAVRDAFDPRMSKR